MTGLLSGVKSWYISYYLRKHHLLANIMALLLYSPFEVATEIADRARSLRLLRGWTQREMAKRAGVALSTLKMFEHGGQISLDRLLRIAAALDDLDSFRKLFELPRARSLDELEARAAGVKRKRGLRHNSSLRPKKSVLGTIDARMQKRITSLKKRGTS